MLPKFLFIIVYTLLRTAFPARRIQTFFKVQKKHNHNRTQRPTIKIILCYSKEEHTQRTHCKQTVYIKTTSWRQHLYTFFTADLFINAWTYFFKGKKRWRKGSPSRLKIAITIIKRNKLKTLYIQNFFRWHNRDIYECTGAFY